MEEPATQDKGDEAGEQPPHATGLPTSPAATDADTSQELLPPSPTIADAVVSQELDTTLQTPRPSLGKATAQDKQSEFARVLARRRQTVDAKGDHFTKEQVPDTARSHQQDDVDAATTGHLSGRESTTSQSATANFYKAKQIAETRDRDVHQMLAEVKQNIEGLRKGSLEACTAREALEEKILDLSTQVEEKFEDSIQQIEAIEVRISQALEDRLGGHVKQIEVLVLGMKALETRMAANIEEKAASQGKDLEALESRLNETLEETLARQREQSEVPKGASIEEEGGSSAGAPYEEVERLRSELSSLKQALPSTSLTDGQVQQVQSMIQPTSELVKEALEIVQRSDKEESALVARLMQAMQQPLNDMMAREQEQRNLLRDNLKEEFEERLAAGGGGTALSTSDMDSTELSKLASEMQAIHMRLTAVQLETKERIEGFSAATSDDAITRLFDERIAPRFVESHISPVKKDLQQTGHLLEERLREQYEVKTQALGEVGADAHSLAKRLTELEEASTSLLRSVQQVESKLLDEEVRYGRSQAEIATLQARYRAMQDELSSFSSQSEGHKTKTLDHTVLIKRLEKLESKEEDGLSSRTPTATTPRASGQIPVFGSSGPSRPSVGMPVVGLGECQDWIEAGKCLANGLEEVLRLVNSHVKSGAELRSRGSAPALGTTPLVGDVPGRKELQRACTPVAVTPREHDEQPLPTRQDISTAQRMPNGTSSGDPSMVKQRSRSGGGSTNPHRPVPTSTDMRTVKGFEGAQVGIPTLRVPQRKAAAPAPPPSQQGPPDVQLPAPSRQQSSMLMPFGSWAP